MQIHRPLSIITSAILLGGLTNGAVAQSNTAPEASFRTPSEGEVISAGGDISVDVSAVDSDGSISSVDLFVDGTYLRTEVTAPYLFGQPSGARWVAPDEALFGSLADGEHQLTAVVTDNDGETTSTSISIVVGEPPVEPPPEEPPPIESGNSLPVTSFATPEDGAQILVGDPVSIEVLASDLDGTIDNVRLSLDGVFIRQENFFPYEWNDPVLQNLPIGEHVLAVVTTDNDGGRTTATLSFEVIEAPIEEPPVVEPPIVEPPIVEPPIVEPPIVEPPPTVAPPVASGSLTEEEAASFLISSTFGPTEDAVEELMDQGYSDWIKDQTDMGIDFMIDEVTQLSTRFADTTTHKWESVARQQWYERALFGEDQLRQRAAFALSQIFVVSTRPRDWLFKSHMQATYMDHLQVGAFGNFRDLLEDVTYSPFMGLWLTHIGNSKADPETGATPDENYAREIMQLMTIGLVELNMDGTVGTDSNGQAIETYDTEDVTELAKVFTGLHWGGDVSPFGEFPGRPARATTDILPMEMNENFHSAESKSFLGSTIPANTPGDTSIEMALDILFEHPNVAPFIGKQLIQRMTTSNPSPAYVARVSEAFESGRFTLPDNSTIGSGERGDLTPVWAAVLLDPEALDPARASDDNFGKVREPIIRFLHWARFAGVDRVEVLNEDPLLHLNGPGGIIGQDPFRSPSVFNFFRPGFVAGGSETGDAGLAAPELQITNSTTAINYPNFMQAFVLRDNGQINIGRYNDALDVADDPDELTDHLDLLLTAGRMTEATREMVRETIASVDGLRDRVQLGVMLTVVSQEYNTQQ